jgi:hypothetical protein
MKMDIDEIRKAEQRAYAKEWRRKNPGKVKQINKRYWENRALNKLQAAESGDKCEK